MAKAPKYPVTPAIHLLRREGVAFEPCLYAYEEKGGTAVSARELGVPEHAVIKTLIMETDAGEPLIVLMHGDKQVSTKELARQIGARSVSPCAPETADKHSGYHVGGTSPFGTRRAMPVYAERTIWELPRVWINGGAKGFLVAMAASELARVLSPVPVDAAID